MNLLVLDGNSIVNRAFYGIKLLTTKSGYYTNAIYGFLNILLKLQDTCHPDGVAVAFDVHEPTFRHKQYADYKAGRKPMPQELRAQMPVLTSPYSLYSESLASFTTGDLYDHHDADGFITLFGLPLKVRAMKLAELKKENNQK